MSREETVTRTLYQYDELTPEAQSKAREWWVRCEDECFEPGPLSEWFRDELQRAALPNEDVAWSLGYCQGDGVAFYGEVELHKWLAHNKMVTRFKGLRNADGSYKVTAALTRNCHATHYSHWNTMAVEVDWASYYSYDHEACDPTDKQNNLMRELEQVIRECVQAQSRELERQGYAEIEYRVSDEAVTESIRANEYEFEADGTCA